MKLPINEWTKCYDSGWKGIITPESFQHPAKMSYGLLKRILAHAKVQGWLREGDVIVDPFGGIGSTGILGAYEGYKVVCVELEEKFCRLGRQNFHLHSYAWNKLGNYHPLILQGDSRRLCEVVEKADLIVSSPPFQESSGAMAKPETYKGFQHVGSVKHKVNDTKAGYGSTDGQLGSMKPGKVDMVVSSPPYAESLTAGGHLVWKDQGKVGAHKNSKGKDEIYGQTKGNLGNLKSGDVDCVISSPPYAESLKGDGTQKESAAESRAKRRTPGGSLGQSQRTQGYGSKGNLGNLKSGDVDAIISSPPYAETPIDQTHMTSNKRGDESDPNYRPSWKKKLKDGYADTKRPYGKSKENLGNLKSGDVDCVISSPPYEGSGTDGKGEHCLKTNFNRQVIGKKGVAPINKQPTEEIRYGETTGNIGNDKGDTFWQAAKTIVEQCHQILKPGGVAIWVVKSFVRNKAIVDFPGDWQRLCESVGFKTVCIHHAMLVKETTHKTLFGDTETKRTERKSFFRRLAESKGSPRIDFEVVLCMETKK